MEESGGFNTMMLSLARRQHPEASGSESDDGGWSDDDDDDKIPLPPVAVVTPSDSARAASSAGPPVPAKAAKAPPVAEPAPAPAVRPPDPTQGPPPAKPAARSADPMTAAKKTSIRENVAPPTARVEEVPIEALKAQVLSLRRRYSEQLEARDQLISLRGRAAPDPNEIEDLRAELAGARRETRLALHAVATALHVRRPDTLRTKLISLNVSADALHRLLPCRSSHTNNNASSRGGHSRPPAFF